MNTRFAVLVALMRPATLRAQDSTAKVLPKEQTLAERLGVKAVHVALGAGSAPSAARTTEPGNYAEFRLGFTLRSLPDWTIAFASNAVTDKDTTAYVAPNSNGFHPYLRATTTGIEIQRRWSSNKLIHPIATVGAGQLTQSYNYFLFPKTGGREYHQDGKTSVTYATLAGGGEVNIAGWMRFVVTAGYRTAGSSSTPFVTGSNSGFSSVAALELGRFLMPGLAQPVAAPA